MVLYLPAIISSPSFILVSTVSFRKISIPHELLFIFTIRYHTQTVKHVTLFNTFVLMIFNTSLAKKCFLQLHSPCTNNRIKHQMLQDGARLLVCALCFWQFYIWDVAVTVAGHGFGSIHVEGKPACLHTVTFQSQDDGKPASNIHS